VLGLANQGLWASGTARGARPWRPPQLGPILAKELFNTHPEYFALRPAKAAASTAGRAGRKPALVRTQGDWYCTPTRAAPALRENVIRRSSYKRQESFRRLGQAPRRRRPHGQSASVQPSSAHPTASPTAAARLPGQDDPDSIEPSSGRVSMTNRYVDFFNDVAGSQGLPIRC